jgi:hypothetical protein
MIGQPCANSASMWPRPPMATRRRNVLKGEARFDVVFSDVSMPNGMSVSS